jgi:hypothetical protein
MFGMQSSFLQAASRYLAMHCTKGEDKKRIAAVTDRHTGVYPP